MHRYWLAEHHNAGALACSAPEVMIAAVAAATTRIRVGAGGIMLPNHSPLKIAETFRVLAALHPGRVDLGVGRAAGTDAKTALALRQAAELASAEGFPAQLDALLAYLDFEPDPAGRFGPIKAIPVGVPAPPVFLLGSSAESARHAARLGLGFAYAHHIAPEGAAEALAAYRAEFVPARLERAPWAILAVAALCADDDRAAEDLARVAAVAMLRFGQGLRDLPLPSVAEARAYTFDADEEALAAAARDRVFTGSPSSVVDALGPLLDRARPDELIVVSGIHDHDQRRRSYELLVRALSDRR